MTEAQGHAKVLQLPVSIDTQRRQASRERAQQRHPSSIGVESGDAGPNEAGLDAAGVAPDDATVRPINAEAAEALAVDNPADQPSSGSTYGWREQTVDGVAALAAFVRERLTGEYDIDEFGFDPQLTDAVLIPLLRPVYEKWFRVEVSGVENLPLTGGALLVANHSGVLPMDGLMASVAVHDNHPLQRHLRLLAADLAFELPVIGDLARKYGSTLACNDDAEALLSRGELVGVWPEGFKGIGKPFRDRYKLQRFGRGGFVTSAIRTSMPIIPVSIVGAEEMYPMIGDLKPLARLLGLPYFPVTPMFPLLGPLGAVPLPSKWHIEFGEPVPTTAYDADDADDPMVIFELTDAVRETIQQTLYRVLARRKNIFQDY